LRIAVFFIKLVVFTHLFDLLRLPFCAPSARSFRAHLFDILEALKESTIIEVSPRVGA
jgi:hypothetical protein